MPDVLVACVRCRQPIRVSSAELDDLPAGGVLVAQHPEGHCPTDETVPLRHYRAVIDIFGDDELMMQVSAKADAPSLVEALPELNVRLNELWLKIQDSAPLAEAVADANEETP